MKLKTVKYIKIDDSNGILYLAGRRILLFPVEFISFMATSFKIFVDDSIARILVYEISEALGKECVRVLKSIESKDVRLSKEIMIKKVYNVILVKLGWGNIKFKELNLKKERIVLESINSPCFLVPKTGYELIKGILAGAYKEITGKAIYYKIIEENKMEKKLTLKATKEIPEEISIKGKVVLLKQSEKEKLEAMVRERTKEFQEKVEELEKFQKLTIGRELKMVKLKKEIKELQKKLKQEKFKK